ncbi:MAG: CCA tRNA nucleotidyltransferase [Anaerolineales bacterium]
MKNSRFSLDLSLIPSDQIDFLKQIASTAASLGYPLYIVGGYVRDLLLKHPANDFDLVVEGDAIQFGDALVKQYGGKLTSHQKFRTAIWHLPDSSETIDLITARKEKYLAPGALPTVTPSTIEDDLQRRDFTVNAMAVRVDGNHFGQLLDPFNGQVDLENKLIRVLHQRSFIEDPTRIFRAIRYEGRYSFAMDTSTLNLINSESVSVIMRLSGERIRHELDLIFEEEHSSKMIQRAGDLKLFEAIHPKFPQFNTSYSDFLEMDPTLDVPADKVLMGYMLWLIDVPEDDLLSIARRLDCSSEMTHSIWAVAQLKRSLPFLVNSKPSVWTFALENLPLLSIYVVYLVTRENALLDYISMWRHIKPHTTGDDLKARGLAPGPRFGEILSQLRAAWLDGEVSNQSQEKELLSKIL